MWTPTFLARPFSPLLLPLHNIKHFDISFYPVRISKVEFSIVLIVPMEKLRPREAKEVK